MVYCPHTFTPQNHVLDLIRSTAEIMRCGVCSGGIRMCNNQKCLTHNRYPAKFCTACGDELEASSLPIDETKLVNAVNERAKEPLEYQLNKVLGNTEEDEPLLWLAGNDGVFIFTLNQNTKETPLNLYYISSYEFQQGVGKKLPNEGGIPEYSQWTQLPLVSKQGLFIPTNKSLHYFPSHGSDEQYEHKIWKTNEAETILSIAVDKSGTPAILIKNSDNKLAILEGNTQNRMWGAKNHRYDLDSDDVGSGALCLITLDSRPNNYWVYSGTNLIHYHTKSRQVVSKKTIKMGGSIPFLLKERISKSYFMPFVTEDAPNNTLKFVLPVLNSVSTNATVNVLPEGAISPRRINDDDQQYLWVKPYLNNGGFAVGFSGCIKGFIGEQKQWEIKKDNTEPLPLVMMPQWLAAFTSPTNPTAALSNSSIIFIPAKQHKGMYMPNNDQSRTGRVDKKGIPLLNLAPLYFDGNMFFALTNGKTTTIYEIQVSQHSNA